METLIIWPISLRPLLFCLIFLAVIKQRTAVLRFCHQGTWHEFKEDECPYGLMFNEKINTPCFYSEGEETKQARIWPSLCGTPFDVKNEGYGFTGENFVLAQRNGEIHMIQYGGSDNDTEQEEDPTWEDFADLSACEDLCYLRGGPGQEKAPYRESHEEGDSEEALSMHHNRGQINETQRLSLIDQTLRLGDHLFDELNAEEVNRKAFEKGPDLRIIQLYQKSIKILSKTCPDPFLPEDFRNRILSGFLFLVEDSGVGEVDDISAEEFEDIFEALRTCENANPLFRLEGKLCSMKTVVSDVIRILPNGDELEAHYRPVDWDKSKTAFPYFQYDPFVEFAWQAVTTIHGACFATFKRHANMHHKYSAAMERLFGEKIRFRWENPTQLEDSRMWGTWFLVDVDTTHLNFGACIAGAYQDAPFAMRLDRPIEKTRFSKIRKKRASSSGNENDNKTVVQNLAKHNAESYWEDYKLEGGIKEKLKGQIQCFQSKEKKDMIVQGLENAICHAEDENKNKLSA